MCFSELCPVVYRWLVCVPFAGESKPSGFSVQHPSGQSRQPVQLQLAERPALRGPQTAGPPDAGRRPGAPALRRRQQRRHAHVRRERSHHHPGLY